MLEYVEYGSYIDLTSDQVLKIYLQNNIVSTMKQGASLVWANSPWGENCIILEYWYIERGQ